MNKIILALLLTTTLAASANAQNCVNASRCDELGYTQTINECTGLNTLVCPFDKNKVFCVYTPQAYTCEELISAFRIPNNRVITFGIPSGVGSFGCKDFTMTTGVSLIGMPDVSMTIASLSMKGDNLLKNSVIKYNSSTTYGFPPVVSGTGKITIDNSTIDGLKDFSEVNFRGNNRVNGSIQDCSKIVSNGKLSVDDIINEKQTGEINTQELDCIAANNDSCSIKNAQIHAKKMSNGISYFSIERSEIYADKVYSPNLSCQNSQIHGDLYFQSMPSTTTAQLCAFSGRVFIKPDNSSTAHVYMYGTSKAGSEIYISSSDNPSNKIYIRFEKDVIVGYGTDLWKTNKEGYIPITNIASYADRIGDFSGIDFPEDLPF